LKFFKNVHFKRTNVYIAESLLPKIGSFIFLPFLFRYVTTEIWAEITLMLAVSELLSKIYLFGFHSSIYRFASDINNDQKNAILSQLVIRILIISTLIFLIFEIFNTFFWSSIFQFEYGLPMRTSIFISIFSAINLFLIQFIKSLRQSRKLFTGSIVYTLLIIILQFSSISYISKNFGQDDRMMVTAYLVSIAFSSLIRSIYYLNFLKIRKLIFKKSNTVSIKEFLNYAKPAAGIGLSAILVTHGTKLVIQSNISLEILGKYFSYLSYSGIYFVVFASTQSYFVPKLFKLQASNSINFRISLMYYWTTVGIVYLLIFSKISLIFIPKSYELETDILITIFIIQIFSANRTLPGLYFDINKNLSIKMYIFVTFCLIFILSIFNLNSLETFLNLNLIFYFVLGNSYALKAREWKMLVNFNLLHTILFLLYLDNYYELIQNQNLILLLALAFIAYQTPRILSNYEKLS